MRKTLGILSALFLCALVAVIVFGSIFAGPWEGGHGGGGPAWENLGLIIPVALIYYLLCACVQFSPRPLLISGIIVHSILAVYFGFCIADHMRYPGSMAPTGLIFPALIVSAIWLAHYFSVRRRQRSNDFLPITRNG